MAVVRSLFQTLIIHCELPERSRILRQIIVLQAFWNGELQRCVFPELKGTEYLCALILTRGRQTTETTRGILLPWASWFRNFCYVTLSDSAVLTADEECTQLKESWICTNASICFHFDPQNPHWKHKASAKTIFETSAYEWMLQLTNMFSFS